MADSPDLPPGRSPSPCGPKLPSGDGSVGVGPRSSGPRPFSLSGREFPAFHSIGARLRALLKRDAGPAMLAVPNPKLRFRRNLRLVDSLTVLSPADGMTICADSGGLYPTSWFPDQYFHVAARYKSVGKLDSLFNILQGRRRSTHAWPRSLPFPAADPNRTDATAPVLYNSSRHALFKGEAPLFRSLHSLALHLLAFGISLRSPG